MWPKLFIIAITLAASTASACPKCGLFGNKCVVRQQVHHVQQVVTPQVYLGAPSINYFVGQEIRVEAIVQQALRQDPGYAEYQKFKAWQAGQAQQQAAKPEAPMPNTALAEPPEKFSFVKASCATSGCHSGDAPSKGLLLDGTGKLSSDAMRKAMKRVSNGTMPPVKSGITLTPENKGDIFQDLLEMSE